MKITLKSSWDEITLADYDWIKSILKLDSSKRNRELLNVLSDLTEDEIDDLSTPVVNKFINRSDFLNETPQPNSLKNTYSISGTDYKLYLAIGELPTSTFIDLCETSNDPEQLPLTIATLMSPKSSVKDRMKLSDEVYNEMSITDAMGISIFFYQLLESFSKIILPSSHSTKKTISS